MSPASRALTFDRRSVSKRRAASLAALLTLALIACACGASNARTEVVRLRSANALTSDLYVRIKGPAGAVNSIVQGVSTGAFSKDGEGFFLPPDLREQKACSFSHKISSADASNLQPWRGKKVTITVYGRQSYSSIYCLGISAGIFGSPS